MFWNKFKSKEIKYRCTSCGQIHQNLPAIGFSAPFHYTSLSESQRKEIATLTSDFCIISYGDQTDRFIRTVLTIPITDYCEDLDYGLWVSVSEKTFDTYKASYLEDCKENVYFGMVCNEISDYKVSTLNLHVNVNTRNGNIRPEIIPHVCEHDLGKDFENGISYETALKRIDKAFNN